MKSTIFNNKIKFARFYESYQLLVTFIIVALVITAADFFFFWITPTIQSVPLFSYMNTTNATSFPSDFFESEMWLGVLSLILGTLIIVISIASQSTPKLIDLYIGDQISLFYIWFLVAGLLHNFIIEILMSTAPHIRPSSIFLNTYVMLPLSFLMAIPYILYILRYTKTSNVISKIHNDNIRRIHLLGSPANFDLFKSRGLVANYQYRMFESLNQLDDLLEYVAFKEPKGDIIQKIGQTVRVYVAHKKQINPAYFRLSEHSRSDISFKTMVGQFDEMEHARVFYEQKAFRLLGNAYIRLIENGDFDLASLCAYEVSECGITAIHTHDDELLNIVIVRFNTLLRFGIKHGLRNSELRNIYNTVFHYGSLINEMVAAEKMAHIKRSCTYLKIYGSEVYRHSRKESSFIFLVDVFALALKDILITLHKKRVDIAFQQEILGLFLQMDTPPDLDRNEMGETRIINDGVRILQVALALFYMSVEQNHFVELIIKDILDDKRILGSNRLIMAVESTGKRLQVSGPTFWEDTDRGNTNIYYSPQQEFIPKFIKQFSEALTASPESES